MEAHGVTRVVSQDPPTRRDVLTAATASTLGATLSALSATEAMAGRPTPTAGDDAGFAVDRDPATGVFPHGVASGGPTPEGVLLWTRVDPDAYDGETPLGVEVSDDEEFEETVFAGQVSAAAFGPERDHTATVDVDGELDSDRRYFYRFVYDGAASEVGRCRTLPRPDADPDSLRLAVASCNNYLHGYFGAFARIAETEADYLVHLGDFIYETGGDGVADRGIDLPSGNDRAHDLADYRHLYRTYRSDENLRRALRSHTMVHVWDDHEVVNDRWWNYDADAPETNTHPHGHDPAFMRRLYVDAIRAYTEYVPARVEYDPTGDDGLSPDALHEEFRLYRSFRFGDLAELFLTDERLYRSRPPDADESGSATTVETAVERPGRTMLGGDQRRWLRDGLTSSDARWKLWGNEVLASAFRFVDDGEMLVNADAWDGYSTERRAVLSALGDADVENLVALTGDMHSYLAGYLLTEYGLTAADPIDAGQRVGVELMAPAISSDNLVSMEDVPDSETVVEGLQTVNPHVEWFDSSHWGFATVTVTRDELTYSAYAVDRSVDSDEVEARLLRRYRVPAGRPELKRVDAEDDEAGT